MRRVFILICLSSLSAIVFQYCCQCWRAVRQTYDDAVPMSFAGGIKPLENYETLSGSSKGRAELLSHNALQDSAGIKSQLAGTFNLH